MLTNRKDVKIILNSVSTIQVAELLIFQYVYLATNMNHFDHDMDDRDTRKNTFKILTHFHINVGKVIYNKYITNLFDNYKEENKVNSLDREAFRVWLSNEKEKRFFYPIS